MHLVAYVSEYVGNDIAKDGMRIMQSSLRNNQKSGITGSIFYHEGKFIQVLEGEVYKLRMLVDKIKNDSRHKNISVFIDAPILTKSHRNWNMDLFMLADGQGACSHLIQYFKKAETGALNYTLSYRFMESFKNFMRDSGCYKLHIDEFR